MGHNHVFRLCHVCRNINEAEEEILRCGHCGKGFLPVRYFEKLKQELERAKIEAAGTIEIPMNPLPGLLVFW
ncbi:MAG TPA: hypothetical protein PLH57_04725 [Oligoflexia bacterium]|nr:hypothetical protein [Oligoflexia bacterium]